MSRAVACTIGGALGLGLSTIACSLVATRPVQEMSDTAAAIRAAREVGADSLAPETYRQALDDFTLAKRNYRLKQFDLAKSAALKARQAAENAEFEAIRKGGVRGEAGAGLDPYADLNSAEPPPPALAPAAPSKPYPYPKPRGIPLERYDQTVGAGTTPAGPSPAPGTAGAGAPNTGASAAPGAAPNSASQVSPYGFR